MIILKIIMYILLSLILLILLICAIPVGLELKYESESGFAAKLRILFIRLDLVTLGKFFSGRKSKKGKSDGKSAGEADVKSGTATAGDTQMPEKAASNGTVGDESGGKSAAKTKNRSDAKMSVAEPCEKFDEEITIEDIPEDEVSSAKLMLKIISDALTRTGSYIGVRIRRFTVVIATKDAAKTAILYGEICAALSAFFAFAANFKKIKVNKKHFSVSTDFLREKGFADISVEFTFFVWHLAHIGLEALMKYMASGEALKKDKGEKQKTDSKKKA